MAAKAKAKQGTNRSALDALLAIDQTIEVKGQVLHLDRPTESAMVSMRVAVVEMDGGLNAKSDESTKAVLKRSLSLAILVVRACVPDLKDDTEALALVSLAGGEASELVFRASELCGMSFGRQAGADKGGGSGEDEDGGSGEDEAGAAPDPSSSN